MYIFVDVLMKSMMKKLSQIIGRILINLFKKESLFQLIRLRKN